VIAKGGQTIPQAIVGWAWSKKAAAEAAAYSFQALTSRFSRP